MFDVYQCNFTAGTCALTVHTYKHTEIQTEYTQWVYLGGYAKSCHANIQLELSQAELAVHVTYILRFRITITN